MDTVDFARMAQAADDQFVETGRLGLLNGFIDNDSHTLFAPPLGTDVALVLPLMRQAAPRQFIPEHLRG